jgi:hypothetical protein
VKERHVARGSFVQIDPIVTLVKTSTLRYRGRCPNGTLTARAGPASHMTIEGDEQPRIAQVTRISPRSMNRAGRWCSRRRSKLAGDLRTGLFAEGEVVVDPAARSLVVPKSAVMGSPLRKGLEGC